MTLGTIIKQYREEHGLSMDEFARLSGISKAYISLLEKDKHPQTGKPITPSIKFIKMAAKGMGADFDSVFKQIDGNVSWDNEDSQYPRLSSDTMCVPLLGKIAAGAPLYNEGNVIGDVYVDPKMAAGGARLFALTVQGDSMAPKIMDGDTLIVREQPDADSGETVVVTVNGSDGTCKKLKKYPDSIALISLNPLYEPMVYTLDEVEQLPVRIVGKVLEARTKL